MLTALANRHLTSESRVPAATIAADIERSAGTVRNQMQFFKSVGLVTAAAGPDGGYRPTDSAYAVIDIDPDEPALQVPVRCNGDDIDELTVTGIDLPVVTHPDQCRANLHVQGALREVDIGDMVAVGPMPGTDLRITGTIDGKDDVNSVLVIQVDRIRASTTAPPA